MEAIIRKILETLEKIDVRGRDNVRRMAAVMNALEEVLVTIEKAKEGKDDEGNDQ
jgi:hypothetical protein